MSKGNFGQAIESLKSLLDSAIIINETDFFRETAQVISNTKKELNNIYSFPDHRKELDDIFIKIVQSILAHLSGNDTETPKLTNILKEIEEHNEKISKYEVVKEGVDIANDD